jgi:hypothetical protein
MNNSQQQELVDHEERFKKLQDLLKQTGFTGNIPFTLNYRSLSIDEKKKFIDETKAVFAHLLNISPNAVPELFRLLDVEEDTSDDDNDTNIQVSDGH